MEDWDTNCDLIIPYIMSFPWIPGIVKQLLAPLWLAVVFFMRFRPGQEGDKHVDSAQHSFLECSKLLQEIFKIKKLATIQLHTSAFHVPNTSKAWGPIRFSLQYWLEDMVQV